MRLVGYLARWRWRRTIGAQVVLAVVVGATVAVVLATATGAVRTRSALGRFVEDARSPDVFAVYRADSGPTFDDTTITRIQQLPQVRAAVARLVGFAAAVPDSPSYLPVGGALDDHLGRDVNRARIIDGREPDPDAADEVTLSERRADEMGVGVGDTIHLETYTEDQRTRLDGDAGPPAGPSAELRVVGIHRLPENLITEDDTTDILVLTPAFTRAHLGQIGEWSRMAMVDLEPGASPDSFIRAVHDLPEMREVPFDSGQSYESSGLSFTTDFVSSALWLFAGLALAVGAVGAGVAMAWLASEYDSDDEALRAIGATRHNRRATASLVGLPGVVAGLLMGTIGGVAATPLMPFGLAGRAEPDPGLHVDPVVIGTGLAVTVAVLSALSVVLAVRHRSARHIQRPSAVVSRLAASGWPASIVAGVRFVFEGRRGRASGPARTAAWGVALGLAGLIVALTATSSPRFTRDHPGLWGWSWDLQTTEEGVAALRPQDILSITEVRVATVQVNGIPAQVRGLGSVQGRLPAPLEEGHVAGPGEIVLGPASAERFGVGIGDHLDVAGDADTVDLEVVGIGPMAGIVDAPILGEGATADLGDILRIAPEDGATDAFDTNLVDLKPGVDVSTAADEITAAIGEPPGVATTPDEFERFDQVRWLPAVLVLFLGSIAVLSTVQSLLAAVRRRRHELGVLRALGFRRRNVSAAMATQAVVVTLLGVVVGVPVGYAVGRWLWLSLAGQLGVIRTVEVPWAMVGVAVLVALVVDLLVSWWPARRATRRPAAEALRSE